MERFLSGVPQGSVLGPISFILYINYLPEVVNSIMKIFADDTKNYNKDSNSDIIQQDLDALCTWAQIWQLRFNVKKCKSVHCGKNNQFYQYKMNFEDIETASEEKDLGVTFQQDLKSGSHIAEKVNDANSTLSLIVSTFDYIEKDSIILLHKSLIRPHVEYRNTIWYPFLRKDIESVEKIQRRATKLIPEFKDMTLYRRLKN